MGFRSIMGSGREGRGKNSEKEGPAGGGKEKRKGGGKEKGTGRDSGTKRRK